MSTSVVSNHAAPSQVRIRLSSRDAEIQLPEVGSILVSTSFRRLALSTLVNKLLETESPVPLDFYINGQLLQSDIDEFLSRTGTSSETLLSVECVRALPPPNLAASEPHDAWVSSVDIYAGNESSTSLSQDDGPASTALILSVDYSGKIRIWDPVSSQVSYLSGVFTPKPPRPAVLKSARWLSPTKVAAAGIDRVIRIYSLESTAKTSSERGTSHVLDLSGHKSTIEHLSFQPSTEQILSASSDGTVGLWSTDPNKAPPSTVPEPPKPTSTEKHKRRKLSEHSAEALNRGPLTLLNGHSSPVSACAFSHDDRTFAHSVSHDHTLRTWDLTTGQSITSTNLSASLFSFTALPSLHSLASGSSTGTISLTDTRASTRSNLVAMTLRGHRAPVLTLAASPSQGGTSWGLASGSADGTIRLWDTRNLASHTQIGGEGQTGGTYLLDRRNKTGKVKAGTPAVPKIFSIAWDPAIGIVSGDSNGQVEIHTVN